MFVSFYNITAECFNKSLLETKQILSLRVDCDEFLNSLILRMPPVQDLETADTVDDDLEDMDVVVTKSECNNG